MISIVITTHGTMPDLPLILGSLLLQKECLTGENSVDGSPYLYAMGKRFEYPLEIIVARDGLLTDDERDQVQELVRMGSERSQIVELAKQGGVGHHTRGPGIQIARGDWIVLTNSDNYFTNGWLHRVVSYLDRSPTTTGMVYWDVVSNLWKWTNHGGSKLKRGFIDLSCVCVRADIAKEVGFPFTRYDGDWDYISACGEICRERELGVYYIPETLAVHN